MDYYYLGVAHSKMVLFPRAAQTWMVRVKWQVVWRLDLAASISVGPRYSYGRWWEAAPGSFLSPSPPFLSDFFFTACPILLPHHLPGPGWEAPSGSWASPGSLLFLLLPERSHCPSESTHLGSSRALLRPTAPDPVSRWLAPKTLFLFPVSSLKLLFFIFPTCLNPKSSQHCLLPAWSPGLSAPHCTPCHPTSWPPLNLCSLFWVQGAPHPWVLASWFLWPHCILMILACLLAHSARPAEPWPSLSLSSALEETAACPLGS